MKYTWGVLESKKIQINDVIDDNYVKDAILCQQVDILEEDGVRMSSKRIYTSGLHLSKNSVDTDRNFLHTNGENGRVILPAADRMSYYIVRMSRDFYLNLTLGEHWIHQDPLHQHIVSGKTDQQPEGYMMTTDYMLHILEDLLGTANPNHNYYYVRLKLRELLFAIHQYSTDLHKLKKKNIAPVLLEKMEQIKAYLTIHFQHPPTIPELAERFMLDEKKIKETFKYIYGITVYKYVIQLRMEKAKTLLLEHCNVSEMALRLGYQSVSHFIKVFKSYYGSTPNKAIQKYKSINNS